MLAVNYTNLRDNLKDYFDRITDSFEPMLVTRKQDNMVIMSQKHYDSLMETIYLMGSKANYKHLMNSIEQFNASAVKEHALMEMDDDKMD